MNRENCDRLPQAWSLVTLGEVRYDRSNSVDPKRTPDELFDLYSIPSYPTGRPELVQGRSVGSTKRTVIPGTVLVGKINPRINRVWTVPKASHHRQIASTEWIALFPVEGLEPDYLRHYLTRDDFRNFLAANVSGVGGSLMRVRPAILDRYPLPLAPTGEQRRIVEAIESYLTRIHAAIATLERVKANLKRHRASVLKAALEGRLVPTEAELARKAGRSYEPASVLLERILKERRRRWEEGELAKPKAAGKPPKDDRWKSKYEEPIAPAMSTLPELPEGWCWTRLDSVSEVQLGQQRHPQYTSAKVRRPYIRAANITWGGLDLNDVKEMGFPNIERYRLEAGDVLLSEASGSPMEAGKPAIWRNEIPGACYQKTLLRVRAINKGSILPEFLRLVFLRDCFAGRFARLAPGVGIVHITAVRLSEWAVPIPPLKEQHRIVDEVERILSCTDDATAEIANQMKRLPRLRQVICKSAFEGKLVDQDPTEEPSSVLWERIKAERSKIGANANWNRGKRWTSEAT